MQVRLCTKGYLTPKIYGGKKFSVPYLQNFNRLKILIRTGTKLYMAKATVRINVRILFDSELK